MTLVLKESMTPLRPAGDIGPYNGWLVAFDTSNLAMGPVFLASDVSNTTINAGIWCDYSSAAAQHSTA
jgi:hypothetical protein